jgi:hypothetical protein
MSVEFNILYGMDSMDVTVHDDGKVTTVLKSETSRTAGGFENVRAFFEDMTDRGYGRQVHLALERYNLLG